MYKITNTRERAYTYAFGHAQEKKHMHVGKNPTRLRNITHENMWE